VKAIAVVKIRKNSKRHRRTAPPSRSGNVMEACKTILASKKKVQTKRIIRVDRLKRTTSNLFFMNRSGARMGFA
jgi:hypothetical protein